MPTRRKALTRLAEAADVGAAHTSRRNEAGFVAFIHHGGTKLD